jgi:hypothetical protein
MFWVTHISDYSTLWYRHIPVCVPTQGYCAAYYFWAEVLSLWAGDEEDLHSQI